MKNNGKPHIEEQMIDNAFFFFRNKEMKKTKMIKNLQTMPNLKGIEDLKHGMTF
jgi:hypothetical protein